MLWYLGSSKPCLELGKRRSRTFSESLGRAWLCRQLSKVWRSAEKATCLVLALQAYEYCKDLILIFKVRLCPHALAPVPSSKQLINLVLVFICFLFACDWNSPCSSGWFPIQSVLLPQPLKGWDDRHKPPWLASAPQAGLWVL